MPDYLCERCDYGWGFVSAGEDYYYCGWYKRMVRARRKQCKYFKPEEEAEE